jgi:hypothetical protein
MPSSKSTAAGKIIKSSVTTVWAKAPATSHTAAKPGVEDKSQSHLSPAKSADSLDLGNLASLVNEANAATAKAIGH